MTSSLMVLLAVALQAAPTTTSSASSSTPVAVVDIQTLGITENNAAVKKRVIDEIKAAGFVPKNRMDKKADCLVTPSCREASVEDLLMAFVVTKVAGSFQVAVKMVSKDGTLAYDKTHYSDSAQSLLNDEWVSAYRNHVTAKKEPVPSAEIEPNKDAPITQTQTKAGRAWWGYSGLGVAALGTVLVVTGTSLTIVDVLALNDQASLGSEKSLAQKRGPIVLGVAGVGALLVGGGALLFFASAPGESE